MTVTNFIWDELSDNVLLETDETDALTARYTNRPEQFGKLLSQYRIEDEKIVERFYHYDGEYSTSALTDGDETVTDTFIYTGYGDEVARTGTTTNPFGYKGAVGYYTNAETSDIYVRNRTYEPALGCWLSADPLGFIDGPNLYRAYFVPNKVDPLGLTACLQRCCCCIENLDIGNVIPLTFRDTDEPVNTGNANTDLGLRHDIYGHYFELQIDAGLKEVDFDPSGPCKLKWEEKLTHGTWPTFYPPGMATGIFYDLYPLAPFLDGSDPFANWRAYENSWTISNSCKTQPPSKIMDWPGLLINHPITGASVWNWGDRRNAHWRLTVSSTSNCRECVIKSITVYARQDLQMGFGIWALEFDVYRKEYTYF